jgi:hypothetical protein
MRRTLLALTLIASLGTLAVRPLSAEAAAGHTAVCAVTSYTVSGSFNRLGGATTFNVSATGSCLGTSSSVVVNLGFLSIGSWSCSAGAAAGSGLITANNGANQFVNATLTNTAGEYVIEVHALNGTAASGQFTTLPIACDLGQTQTTIPGTGTLTFTA